MQLSFFLRTLSFHKNKKRAGKKIISSFWGGLFLFFSLFLIFWFFFSPQLFAQSNFISANFTPDEKNNIEVFQKTKSSVVYVTTNQLVRDFFSFREFENQSGSGTGFVWDRNGIIVTNFHVIANSNSISVRFNDPTSYKARVVGIAPEKDIAILKVDAPKEKFIPLSMGDSSKLRVGNKVLAIGNPFGLDQTLTTGIVSALGRQITSPADKTITGVIQTDAAINPGNSGGPLLNSQGEVVGINTSILSRSGASAGIGFAIPSNEIQKVVPQLIQYGKIQHLSLGLRYLDDSLLQTYRFEGVVVVQVLPNSSAAKAGITALRQNANGQIFLGDQITAIDQQPVASSDAIYQILEKKKQGKW